MTFDETMAQYSPDNRLSLNQYVGMAARMQDRYGVSTVRAMQMVQDTIGKRQALLDERVKGAGGRPWAEIKKDPNAADYWGAYNAAPFVK